MSDVPSPCPRPLLGVRLAATVAATTTLVGALGACSPAGDDDGPGTAIGASAGVNCTYRPSGEPARPVDPPDSAGVEAHGTVGLSLATNRGPIGLVLDRGEAPCAVNSLTALAEQKFYDDTECHRLTTEQSGLFVLQCGDPTGTGRGGPGYTFDDEIKPGQTYPAGTVALANVGANTNGSQFFLVYEDSPLPAHFTAVGHLDAAGLQTVRTIARAGADDSLGPGDGSPRQPVTITRASVQGS